MGTRIQELRKSLGMTQREYNETKEAFYKEGVAANTYYVWSSITTATTLKVCYTGKSFTIKAYEDDKTQTINYYYFGQLAVSPEVSSIKSTFTSQHNASVQSALTGDSTLCGVLEGTRISSTATLGKAPSGYKYSFDQFTLFDAVNDTTLATHTASATFGYSNSTQMVANKPKWVMAVQKRGMAIKNIEKYHTNMYNKNEVSQVDSISWELDACKKSGNPRRKKTARFGVGFYTTN